MCRWIAYISPSEPCLLSDVLIKPAHSLTKQVSTHYLPYLIAHQLAPIDMVSPMARPSPLPSISASPVSLLAPPMGVTPPPRLAPPTTSPTDPSLALKLRNLALNTDGHGLVWYTYAATRFENPLLPPLPAPCQFRSALPLSSSPNFSSLAANTSTTCLMAHVRAGSGAPPSELNCHPFVFGRVSVMHNGSIVAFARIKRALLAGLRQDVFEQIAGGTDSEVLAALIIQRLPDEDGTLTAHQLADAIVVAFEAVFAAQRAVLGRTEPCSLNVCATDGRVLVATRFRNAGEEPPSLYWSATAGVTLNSKYPGHPDGEVVNEGGEKKGTEEHGRHIIVASEPSTFKEQEWTLLGRNRALVVGADGEVEVKDIVVEGIAC